MANKTSYLITLAMLLVSSVAPAAQLLFNLDGTVAPSPPTNWLRKSPAPSTWHASFVLDTLSASSSTFTPCTDPSNPSQPCLGHFALTGLEVSKLHFKTDRGTLWSANHLSADISGDNAGGNCPGGFFADLSFSKAGNTFEWTFDPSPGISQADIASSADPLATLLLGFQVIPGNVRLTGRWGTLYAGATATTITTINTAKVTAITTAMVTAISTATVSTVPLPSSIVLFASGLFGLAWYRRRQI